MLDSQREVMARTTAELNMAHDQADQVWSEWLVQEERRVTEEAQASRRTERATRSRTKIFFEENHGIGSIWFDTGSY